MIGFISDLIFFFRNKVQIRKILNRMKRINPNPRTFRMWEHNSWGDKIAYRGVDRKKNIIRIVGWLRNRPHNGDWLIYKIDKGYVKGIIYNVEYQTDPKDMFFADVKPIEKAKI